MGLHDRKNSLGIYLEIIVAMMVQWSRLKPHYQSTITAFTTIVIDSCPSRAAGHHSRSLHWEIEALVAEAEEVGNTRETHIIRHVAVGWLSCLLLPLQGSVAQKCCLRSQLCPNQQPSPFGSSIGISSLTLLGTLGLLLRTIAANVEFVLGSAGH